MPLPPIRCCPLSPGLSLLCLHFFRASFAQGDDIVQRLLPLLPRLGAGPSDLLALNFGEQAR